MDLSAYWLESLFAQAIWEPATADTGWPPPPMQAKVCKQLGRALCISGRVREGRNATSHTR